VIVKGEIILSALSEEEIGKKVADTINVKGNEGLLIRLD
jgi:hypothetical protein